MGLPTSYLKGFLARHSTNHLFYVPNPERWLFAQYHAPPTLAMKEMIMKQLKSKCSTVRDVFATVAIGVGVDIPSIE